LARGSGGAFSAGQPGLFASGAGLGIGPPIDGVPGDRFRPGAWSAGSYLNRTTLSVINDNALAVAKSIDFCSQEIEPKLE
jgi:hypothetical protein